MARRRKFSPQQKLDILRWHLLEGTPVSELCDEHEHEGAVVVLYRC